MSHHLLQYFKHDHLDADHQSVVKPVCDLVRRISEVLKDSPEKTDALAALLKANTFLSTAPLSGPLPDSDTLDSGLTDEIDELRTELTERDQIISTLYGVEYVEKLRDLISELKSKIRAYEVKEDDDK